MRAQTDERLACGLLSDVDRRPSRDRIALHPASAAPAAVAATSTLQGDVPSAATRGSGWLLGLPLIVLALGVAADPWRCAAWSVALFAGLHNWTELRYALRRTPARAGPLLGFMVLALGGVSVLGAAYVALSLSAAHGGLSAAAWRNALSLWETCLVLWGLGLAASRARLPPRRAWFYVYPIGCVLIALAWLAPAAWSLGLVFAHPLLALAMLDRELARLRSPWRQRLRQALRVLPIALAIAVVAATCWHDLPRDVVSAHGAGRPAVTALWPADWTGAMLSAYAFLELLHYGAWILAIPAASRSGWGLNGDRFPLARRSWFCRRALATWLALGALAVCGLWFGFAWDYAWTWTWYFRLAIFHVLLEIPLLLRSL